MRYDEYIQRLSFRFYGPQTFPKGFTRISQMLRIFHLSFEILNTRLPEHERMMRARLRDLLAMPRMSTFAIGALLNTGVSQLPDDACFVNVGVWNGFTFLAGLSGNPEKACVGIDNFSKFGGPKAAFLSRFHQYRSPKHAFYEMDYADYFTTVHQDAIGLYLYDGEHSYANQLKGLRIAEPFFHDRCYLVIDDTNRPDPRQATLDFIDRSPNTYQILLDQPTCVGDHPTFWNGLMIVRRVPGQQGP